jgi:hypothetical protein
MQDDVDAMECADLDGDVDTERDGDNANVEDEQEYAEEDEDEDREDDESEDDGKESRTIGQGEMVSTSPDDIDTMVDDEAILRPEQGQEMHEHTPPL